jgi:hypothetical protein
MGLAGTNLMPVLTLIERRSGISALIPNTLNIRLSEAYHFRPDFVVTKAEYGHEELLFQHCLLGSIRCVIMRPSTHEDGSWHGPAHLELMSSVWLRERLSLQDGDLVTVEIGELVVSDVRDDNEAHPGTDVRGAS